MNNFYVYGLVDPENNLPFYIGKGTIRCKSGARYRRIKEHLQGTDKTNYFKCKKIKEIRSKGLDVKVSIYESFELEKDAFEFEMHLIKKYGRLDKNTGILTNLTDGGEGPCGLTHSEEVKKKNSERMKKWIKENGVPFKGCKHKPETREKMSMIQKEIFKSRKGTFTGKRHTEETKRKISEKAKGRIWPKEIRLKFGSPGAKNNFAQKYIFTNPNGKTFQVEGEFKKFIRKNDLSWSTCKEYINKGKIPEPKNPKHNRLTQERKNTTGWEIVRIQKS